MHLDKSGGFKLKNIGMSTHPMLYGDTWEYTPKEELATCVEDWIGKPVFCTLDHPSGFSIDDYSNNNACGVITNATLVDESINFELYLWGEKTLQAVASGKYWSSTAYNCMSLDCDIDYDNSAKILTTNEPFVKIKKRNVGIIPLHLLLTDQPRAGNLTLLRTNKMEKQIANLLAPLAEKLDTLNSEMDSIKENMTEFKPALDYFKTLSNSDETAEDKVDDEVAEEAKENSTDEEKFDEAKVAELIVEKLMKNTVANPTEPEYSSMAEMFSNRWKGE